MQMLKEVHYTVESMHTIRIFSYLWKADNKTLLVLFKN